MRQRSILAAVAVLLLATSALAAPGDPVMIEGVKGIVGPECTALSMTRARR